MVSPMPIITQRYSTPCGDLVLGSYGDELCMCDWVDGARHDQSCRRLIRGLQSSIIEGHSSVLTEARRQLDEYFEGQRQVFALPLLRIGTAFQRSVWEALDRVAFGETISYTELSRRIGRPKAIRAVATNVGNNPHSIISPCHRIIGSDGSLTGYAGGLETKLYLLQLEGCQL